MEQQNRFPAKYLIVGLLALVAILLAAILQLTSGSRGSKQVATPPAPRPALPQAASGGLGGEIYEAVQNPVKDKLPETNPFAKESNPVSASYKNPFE